MVVFEKTGKDNSENAVKIALQKAMDLGTDIVVASGSGYTAQMVLDYGKKSGFEGKVVVVRSVSKAALEGGNKMTPEVRKELIRQGAAIVSAGHALSAGERGLSSKFHGIYPLEIMAAALRTFGQGVKVCFECSVMALDADEVRFNQPIVALGGSSQGADTAVVITPSYSATILDTKIHEILCKPGLYQE